MIERQKGVQTSDAVGGVIRIPTKRASRMIYSWPTVLAVRFTQTCTPVLLLPLILAQSPNKMTPCSGFRPLTRTGEPKNSHFHPEWAVWSRLVRVSFFNWTLILSFIHFYFLFKLTLSLLPGFLSVGLYLSLAQSPFSKYMLNSGMWFVCVVCFCLFFFSLALFSPCVFNPFHKMDGQLFPPNRKHGHFPCSF